MTPGLKLHKDERLVQQDDQTASVSVQAAYVRDDMWCEKTNVLVLAAAQASGIPQALRMQHVSVCQAAGGRSSADGAAEEDGWRGMKMDEDGWRCCHVCNSAGILLFFHCSQTETHRWATLSFLHHHEHTPSCCTNTPHGTKHGSIRCWK